MTDDDALTPPTTSTPYPDQTQRGNVAAGMSRAQQFLVPSALLLAIVGIAVGVISITKQSDYVSKHYVSQLRTELNTDDVRIANLKQQLKTSASTDTLTGVETSLGLLRAAVNKLSRQSNVLKICLPQLEDQVENETIDSDTQNGYLTSANLDDPTIISSNCTSTLYGS